MTFVVFLLAVVLVPVLTLALARSSRFNGWLERFVDRFEHQGDSSQASTLDESPVPEVEAVFKSLMSRLQVTPEMMPKPADEKDADTTASFEYQGGHFVAMFRNNEADPFENSMSISYFNCYSLPTEHVNRAGELANIVNNLMLPVKCTYVPNLEEGDVSFSLHSTGIRLADDAESVDFIRSLLLCFFRVQRMLFERFEDMKGDFPSEVEANRLIFGHQLYAITRMEINEQSKPFSEPFWNPAELTLGKFIDELFGILIEPGSVLTINGASVSDDVEVIREFPLLSTVVEGQGHDAHMVADAALISVRSHVRENHEILVSLRAERIDGRLITVRVNAMVSALPVTPFRAPSSEETVADARTVVIGVPCVTPEAFLAEAKYMAEEMGLVNKCKNPDAAYSLYWGKILYTDGRLYEADHYLTNAYSLMSPMMEHPEEVAADTIETFYEICYFLGVVNCALGRYYHAYYFLDLIVNQHRVMWTEQYVACLMAMHDPRCPAMIAGLLENVKRQRDESDEADEESSSQLTPFIDFMERQQIVLDIRAGKTDKARRTLTAMLTDDPDNSFAIYWLKNL